MDNQIRLHAENLSLFVEPTFKRQTIGYYSTSAESGYRGDESEKASLVALKEVEKTSQGVTEYEVPAYIEELDLTEGYETYNDHYDCPNAQDTITWLKDHPKQCVDVDIICSHQIIAKIFKAPFTESTATPWEVKVSRGPDGICYLDEDEMWRPKYNEMNSYTQRNYFRQRAFQRYMTIKKGVRSKYTPPSDHSNAFYRVNRLELDSGVIIYPSEIQCFDINYNALDLRAQRVGQFDLPSPAMRLNWWSDSYLAGSNTLLCGYYDDEEADDEATVQRLVTFDLKHVKPRRIRDINYDEEISVGSLCTFVQFIKDVTLDGSISNFVIRFEPGSKRMCVLEVTARSIPHDMPNFSTQVSATDETSSVEATPRTPRETVDILSNTREHTGETMPRLRKIDRQDSLGGSRLTRRNTMTTEMGGSSGEPDTNDNDDNKYRPKRKRKSDTEEDNYLHVAIILGFIFIVFVVIPLMIEWFGLPPVI